MSRTIIFRGVAAVNDKSQNIKAGSMVYGQFIMSGVDAPCIIFDDGEQIEIKLETLGQFTDVRDKNNRSIFEGDILSTAAFIWQVSFDDRGCFIAHSPDDIDECVLLDDYDFEVIGNIHESPELLEVKS